MLVLLSKNGTVFLLGHYDALSMEQVALKKLLMHAEGMLKLL